MARHMKRREFLLLSGVALSAPRPVRAQQVQRRIGILMGLAKEPIGQSRVRAFQELARIPADVILVQSNPVLSAVQQETRTVPIVFVLVSDPVGSGFIESLAKPGGNTTGFATYEDTMGGKWLEGLKEIAPSVTRAGVLFNPQLRSHAAYLRAAETAAVSLGVSLTTVHAKDLAEAKGNIEAFGSGEQGGLVVFPQPLANVNRDMLVELAARYHLPAVYPFDLFAQAGGLMSYGIDQVAIFRQAAAYVDRILRGLSPAELPVQAPSKFELVINLRTAKALGLTVPPSLLARADEVIE
jgi:putative ABC transport system substrate-binding protein